MHGLIYHPIGSISQLHVGPLIRTIHQSATGIERMISFFPPFYFSFSFSYSPMKKSKASPFLTRTKDAFITAIDEQVFDIKTNILSLSLFLSLSLSFFLSLFSFLFKI